MDGSLNSIMRDNQRNQTRYDSKKRCMDSEFQSLVAGLSPPVPHTFDVLALLAFNISSRASYPSIDIHLDKPSLVKNSNPFYWYFSASVAFHGGL